MTVRELVIKLTLDSLGFRSDVRAAQNGLDRLGAAAGQAGAVASRGLERAGREARAAGSSMMDAADAGSRGFSRLAEVLGKVGMLLGGMAAVHGALSGYMEDVAEIEKTSDMLGMSMEAWQGWQYAAKQAGLEAEDVRDRLMDLGDWMTDLNVNDGGPLKDFAEKTKTSFKDAKGATVSLEEGLMRLADAAGKMGRQQATSWLVQIGFDEKTIPLILKGRKAIEEFVRAGKEQALYHKRDVENARRMREAWQAVTATFSAVAAAVIRVLGPVFDWLAETLGDVVVWVRRNESAVGHGQSSPCRSGALCSSHCRRGRHCACHRGSCRLAGRRGIGPRGLLEHVRHGGRSQRTPHGYLGRSEDGLWRGCRSGKSPWRLAGKPADAEHAGACR